MEYLLDNKDSITLKQKRKDNIKYIKTHKKEIRYNKKNQKKKQREIEKEKVMNWFNEFCEEFCKNPQNYYNIEHAVNSGKTQKKYFIASDADYKMPISMNRLQVRKYLPLKKVITLDSSILKGATIKVKPTTDFNKGDPDLIPQFFGLLDEQKRYYFYLYL